ncbi:MAG: diguanylate cyclase [Rubrimonas sp.]
MAGRILIVDDVATNRLLLNLLLTKSYYEVEEAENGFEALELANRNPPDLALIDLMMPGMNGYELCRRLKSNPATADVPVVIITGVGAKDGRVRALTCGADDFLTKPVREDALMARLRALLRMKAMIDELRLHQETMRGLIADSPPPMLIEPPPGATILGLTSDGNAPVLRQMIEPRLDVRLQLATNARTAFQMAAAQPPETLLMDALGFTEFSAALCAALRGRAETRLAPMLTLVAPGDHAAAAAALDAGSNDYAHWPIDPPELTARLRNQLRYKAYADNLRNSVADGLKMALSDPLTGLRNRRYLDAHLAKMIERALAQTEPLCVMAFDLDRFKAVNDRYGHAAGDAILRQFAKRLVQNTRSVDLVARTGGEEFIVAMPETSVADARVAAERVRRAVENPGFDTGEAVIAMTVSVGVASLRARGDSASRLLARADAALYASKSGGRNRVTLAAA